MKKAISGQELDLYIKILEKVKNDISVEVYENCKKILECARRLGYIIKK